MSALPHPVVHRRPRRRWARTTVTALVTALLAGLLTATGLVAGAAPASAADTDLVNVPDPEWRAVLNKAISSSRAPDAPITVGEALAVTTINVTANADRRTITDFTGVEAFTNVTNVSVGGKRATAGPVPTVSDLTPWAALTKVTSFQLTEFPAVTDLTPLASLLGVTVLSVNGSGVSDLAPVTRLPQLTSLSANSSKVSDLSPLSPLKSAPQFTSLNLGANRIVDLSPLTGFKNLTSLNLSNNRLEDIGVISTFDSTYALCGATATGINVAGNHVRDLSVTCQGVPTAPKITGTNGQTVYAGPYTTGGVQVGLKARAGYTPTVADPALGSYDTATGVLTSTNPAAPLLAVRELSATTFSNTWTVYFSEDPAKIADLRINEVESDGDARGDWVELYNPNPTPVNLSGVIVSDDDNTHRLTFPTGTTIPGRGYRALVTDDVTVTGNFGLGGDDDVRIFAPGITDLAAATPLDTHTWTTHATSTYGRTEPGAGRWETTEAPTFEAANVFPAPVVVPTVTLAGDATSTTGSATVTATLTKPNSTDKATDATGGVVFTLDGTTTSAPVAVTDGVATWTVHNLTGSPSGTAHEVTARYVSAGETDPYDDSPATSPFTVTVTIGEFSGQPALSTTTPRYCDTVTSTVAGITPVPDQISYQWQEFTNGGGGSAARFVNIPGATTSSHPMYSVSGTAVDVTLARPYRLLVTATKAGYAPKTWTTSETTGISLSTWTAGEKKTAALSTTTPRVGDTITATHDAWTTCFPASLDYRPGYEYQWLRDGQPISGATDEVADGIGGAGPKQVSYVTTAEDAGHTISLQVVGLRPGALGDSSFTTSAATAPVAPGAFTSALAPTISTTSPRLGETLTATTAAWSPVAAHAYVWLRDGQPISGATSATYTTVPADVDHAISVRVTGTADGYAPTERTSTATAKVTPGIFTQTPAPVVDNTSPIVGDTLRATVGAWSPSAAQAFQWLRDAQPIPGATSSTYTTTAADVDRAISVRVTGTATGYTTVQQTSATTAKVRPMTIQRNPTIKATALKGRKVRISITVDALTPAALPKTVTAKVTGAKGSYRVKLKNGVGTLALKGAKAKKIRTGTTAKVTVTVNPFTTTTGATTIVVAATTKTVQVPVKK